LKNPRRDKGLSRNGKGEDRDVLDRKLYAAGIEPLCRAGGVQVESASTGAEGAHAAAS